MLFLSRLSFYVIFKRKSRGWILVDALIGVTILAVAITAGIMIAQQTTVNTKFNSNYAKATYLAQREMESLKYSQDGTGLALSLVDWPKTEAATATPNYPAYTITATSPAITAPNANINPVEISVTWTEASLKNQQITATLRGYRIQNY